VLRKRRVVSDNSESDNGRDRSLKKWQALRMEEIEVWRTAQHFIDAHGDGAIREVAERADEMRDRGNLDGFKVWIMILKAVKTLSSVAPRANKPPN
jgi:hypothetical protein